MKKKTFYIELTEMDFVTLMPLASNKEDLERIYKSMQPGDTLVLKPAHALSFSREGDTIIFNAKGSNDARSDDDQNP